MTTGRILPPNKEMFRLDEDIPEIRLMGVEGDKFANPPVLKVLMVTEDMECLKLWRKKGFVDPKHAHEDHTTICILLQGKLRLHIGNKSFVAEPGDVWMHPQGMTHWSEALKDSCQLEVKSPACKTW